MIGDEKLKNILLLDYKICNLYLASGATTSVLSEVCEIPLASVKNSIDRMSSIKRECDYLRLIPTCFQRETIDSFRARLIEKIEENKQNNKWNVIAFDISRFEDDVKEIKELHRSNNPLIDDEKKSQIRNMRIEGASMGKIAQEFGISKGSVHKIVSDSDGKGSKK